MLKAVLLVVAGAVAVAAAGCVPPVYVVLRACDEECACAPHRLDRSDRQAFRLRDLKVPLLTRSDLKDPFVGPEFH